MDIQKSILAILDQKNKIIGTGFLAGDGLILTCAHVAEKATGIYDEQILNKPVTVRFAADRSEAVARVAQYSSSYDGSDVALLRVDSVPDGLTPLPLGNAAGSAGHDFYAYGYATVTNVQGIGARGKIVDIVDDGRLVQLTSQEPDHGMSGGPVWDEQRRVVIGMVTKGKGILENQNLRNTQTTFAISVEVIREVCPEIKIALSKRKRHQKGARNISIGQNVTNSIIFNGDDNQVSIQLPLQGMSAPNSSRGTNKSNVFIHSPRLIHPKIPSNYLHRPQLTDKIQTILLEKSVLIRADAGYGKTWLIKDFVDTAATNRFVTWACIPKNYSDALGFILDLASDIYDQTQSVGLQTLQLVMQRKNDTDSELRPSRLLSILLSEIENHPDLSFLLIVEDLHNLVEEIVPTSIMPLLESRPKNLQIILASRNPLPSGQAKLIAGGYLSPLIEQTDLVFSLEETHGYLTSVKRATLLSEQVEILYRRSEGWIAALSLGLETLQEATNVQEVIRKLSGFDGNIYNFFADEVYNGFSEDIKHILKRLGLARLINADVVNLFSGRSDGGQILKGLAGHNTFMTEASDEQNRKEYQLHSLFAEFLETKLIDEEGSNTVRLVHAQLAAIYSQNKKHFLAIEHAIDAEEWQLAVQNLEIIGPEGVGIGYGKAFLNWIEKIPIEWLHRSAQLCETTGEAHFQLGDYRQAAEAFTHAEKLYRADNETKALNRLEYLSAEIMLQLNNISAEDFLQIANKVSQQSYQQNEILLGVQVDLRLIQVGTTLVTKYGNMFQELTERSALLLQRIEHLGSGYDLIHAKILAAQAHLTFEVVSFVFKREVNKVLLREKIGHPIQMEERVAMAQQVINGMRAVWDLYKQAENIAEGKSQIEWAIIYSQHLRDYSYHLFQTISNNAIKDADTPLHTFSIDSETKNYLLSMLVEYEKCVTILEKYEFAHILAKTLCEAAAVYDLLGNLDERNRLANIALQIANEKEFTDITEQAQGIIRHSVSFVQTMNNLRNKSSDEFFASLTEEQKSHIIENILRAISGPSDMDIVRNVVSIEVEDVINVAKQRMTWCRHVQITQDLRHTQSIEMFYRSIPEKWIVCTELHHQSPTSGDSFEKLWPMFKGVYCLGCTKRSLRP